MPAYNSISGGSNILGYDVGDTAIQVWFKNGSSYTYTYESAGMENVEEMKRLAASGEGLNSFILQNVKFDYE